MSLAHVFPDANILLHFPAFDGLDWCELCRSDDVVIHLTQPLLKELNRVKDTGHSKTVRKRAATIQRRLKELLRAEGTTAKITPNVTVVLEALSPVTSDFPELNPSVADDVLLAAVLTFCKTSGLLAKLVTDDDGFALMVKAAKWSIEVIEPLEAARLPAELDPEDKEREALRKRVAKIENATPSLRLAFTDGKTTFHLPKPVADSEADIAQQMFDLRHEHRKLDDPKNPKSGGGLLLGRFAPMNTRLSDMMSNDPKEVARYNEELEAFFESYELALRANFAIDARKTAISLQVENSGSAPANDALVEMHFPNGFRLIRTHNIAALYEALPEAPLLPGHVRGFGHLLPSIARNFTSATAGNPNSPTLHIRETNSYDVRWRMPKLRQGYVSTIDTMVLVFDDAPFSFQIDYTIVADNLPETAKGEIHIIAA